MGLWRTSALGILRLFELKGRVECRQSPRGLVDKAGLREESKENKTEISFLWTLMRRWFGLGLTSRREASMGYFASLQACTDERLNGSGIEKLRAFRVQHVC